MKDHWDDYQNRWHLLEPPLRPHQDVIDAIDAAVGEQSSNVLSAETIGALWQPSEPTQTVRHAIAIGRWSVFMTSAPSRRSDSIS